MTTEKISREIAEADFDRFCDMARLDFDRPRNTSERRDLDDDRASFIYFVEKGRITVDEEGYPTVHTDSEELPAVRFGKRPRVTSLRAMDKVKKNNDNGKMIAMMADTLMIPSAKFNTLEYADFEIVSLVFSLFLG